MPASCSRMMQMIRSCENLPLRIICLLLGSMNSSSDRTPLPGDKITSSTACIGYHPTKHVDKLLAMLTGHDRDASPEPAVPMDQGADSREPSNPRRPSCPLVQVVHTIMPGCRVVG
ncbi:protein of unknown function [Hyphomicrobium sp. MC1]|nr:protein of unknown function [Hyphomicrobium sp. MC1]